jgi:hypothetical protein
MSLLLALLAAAAQPAVPEPSRLEFLAGRAARGRWRMEAFTIAGTHESPPTIVDRRCTIAGPGFDLRYSNRGTTFEIGGAAYGFRTADIIGFEIGGIAYEAQWPVDRGGDSRFSDVAYPPGFVDTRDPPMLGTALGVRHRPEEPWLSHVVLIDDMFAVPSIVVRYRQGGRQRSVRLSATGLAYAIRWCEETFYSDRARRLPERLRRILLR